jgi:hypothetical protein
VTARYIIGSISSGTMRAEDLIDPYLDALEQLDAEQYASFIEDADVAKWLAGDEVEDETLDELVNELHDKLNDLAPPFFYFGSHEGDGADFGFWFSSDSFESACQDGDILKLDAGDEWPEDIEGYSYVAEVTDHGNVTLYNNDRTEVWSIV